MIYFAKLKCFLRIGGKVVIYPHCLWRFWFIAILVVSSISIVVQIRQDCIRVLDVLVVSSILIVQIRQDCIRVLDVCYPLSLLASDSLQSYFLVGLHLQLIPYPAMTSFLVFWFLISYSFFLYYCFVSPLANDRDCRLLRCWSRIFKFCWFSKRFFLKYSFLNGRNRLGNVHSP